MRAYSAESPEEKAALDEGTAWEYTSGGHDGNPEIDVLLLDAQDFTSVAQTEVSAANGRYQYQLSDVQTGDYVIFAGSDRDYDGYVGDAGESAGAYLSLDQPQVISVSANRSGINFTTGLDVNLPALRNHGPAKLKAGIRRQPLPMP